MFHYAIKLDGRIYSHDTRGLHKIGVDDLDHLGLHMVLPPPTDLTEQLFTTRYKALVSIYEGYDLFLCNCEHVSRYLVHGIYLSSQWLQWKPLTDPLPTYSKRLYTKDTHTMLAVVDNVRCLEKPVYYVSTPTIDLWSVQPIDATGIAIIEIPKDEAICDKARK